jgi:hypothetical protein
MFSFLAQIICIHSRKNYCSIKCFCTPVVHQLFGALFTRKINAILLLFRWCPATWTAEEAVGGAGDEKTDEPGVVVYRDKDPSSL